MDTTVQAATNAVEQFLRNVLSFDDNVVAECDELLLSVWYIDHAQIRMQIIQTAALNVGWLSEDDLN